jgi:hypothetical protein
LAGLGKERSPKGCLLALWPEIAIIAAVVAAFEPTLLGSAHIPYDAEFYNYPLLRTVQEQLSSGTLPAWDADTYGGIPLLANAQSAWLYPPHLILDGILSAIAKPLTEHTLDVIAILHVAIAGLGTAAVARGRRLGKAGAAFAGIFVVLNGETVAQAQHVGMSETFAWLPLAILIVDRMRERGITPRRVVALGALFALMISAGFLPVVTACAALLIGVAIAQGPRRLRTLQGVMAGMALGIAMAGAMLLPILAVLHVYPLLEAHGSLPTTGLVTTIFPNAFGQWRASLAEYRGTELTNAYFYVGASVLIILPLALTTGRKVISDTLLVTAMLLASFGASGSHIATAIQSIPTVGLLWRPEDVVYVAMIPVALLLARGLSRAPSMKQLVLSALPVAVFGVVTFSAGHGYELHLFANAPRRTLLALVLVAACVLVAGVLHARSRQPRTVVVALAVAAIVAGADLASAVPDRFFINAPGAATGAGPNATGDGSGVLSALREQVTPEGRIDEDLEFLPAEWVGFPPIWHLSDVNGFQPQFSKYQLARVEATGAKSAQGERKFPLTPEVRPYLEELDVRDVVVTASHDPFAGVRGYTLVFQDGSYHVYRVDAHESRAYVISEGCLRDHGALNLLACRTEPTVRTTLTGPATRRLQLTSASASPLLLITGEPWYPGWQATSSAGPLSVQRVGYLAAVSVPRGTTQVQLTYHAPGLLLGVILSVLAILGSLLAVTQWRSCATRLRASRVA